MALDPLSVSVVLDSVKCIDEGVDGGPKVEPYLWTVFFKVDGSTVALSDVDLTLTGTPVTRFTPGSHGNLGVDNMDTGQTVPVPAAIGRFQTTLRAIPVSPEIQKLGAPPKVAGVIGVICTLMEFDLTSNRVAEAGHQALNTTIAAELKKIVDKLGVFNQEISPGDINATANKVKAAVIAAVKAEGGIFQDMFNLVNADDFIGAAPFIVSHTSLEADGTQSFTLPFRTAKVGDWDIRGHVTAA